jgi:hypothetical protein
MLRLSSWMAMAVGVALILAQVVRNYDNLEAWPTWGIDILAGLILIYGGWRAIKRRSDRSLAAAWAFPAGLFLSAFASYFQALAWSDPDGTLNANHMRLAVITGGLMVVCVAGVAMSLLGKKG